MKNWMELQELLTTDSMLIRIVISIISLAFALLLRSIARRRLNNLSVLNSYEPHRLIIIRKIITAGFWLLLIIVFLTIWGVNFENMIVYFGSFITLVAIGFFAVWSILSNVIAGLLIYLVNPFKVGSRVKLTDPEIEATVKSINLIFTELEDDEGVMSLPNNWFFQKSIKVLKTD